MFAYICFFMQTVRMKEWELSGKTNEAKKERKIRVCVREGKFPTIKATWQLVFGRPLIRLSEPKLQVHKKTADLQKKNP